MIRLTGYCFVCNKEVFATNLDSKVADRFYLNLNTNYYFCPTCMSLVVPLAKTYSKNLETE